MRLCVRIPRSPSLAMTNTKAEDGEPLSPVALHFSQPQLNTHIILILGLGKIVTAENIRDGLQATILQLPQFSSIPVFDKTWRRKLRWVPTKVNFHEHIIVTDPGSVAAEADGDPTVGDLYVENYTSGLRHSPLDSSRPLWDLHIISLRTSEAACTIIFRLHHSLGDGISLMSLLHAITRRTSDPESLPSLPKARHRPTFVAPIYGNPFKFLSWILMFLIYTWNTLIEVIIFISTVIFLKDTKTPITAKEGLAYRPKQLFVHRTIFLDDINVIKNTIGCTINDVFIGVISAALSRYLSRAYGGMLPKHLRIRTFMIANIRSTSGINNLADMIKKDSEVPWGNKFGYLLLQLPIMKYEDPLDYVRKGAAIAEKKKKSFAAILNYRFSCWINKIFGSKVAVSLIHTVLSHVTFIFSNLVGPIEEVDFCGSPLVYIATSIYGHQHPSTIHVQSYVNKIKVILAVDQQAFSDAHTFLDDMSYSVQIIKDAATFSNYKATKIE